MKYLKLFILMAALLPFFTSCSEDEDVNTTECTVGFESDAIKISETAGITQIPINVSGYRNGPVKVVIETEPVGENGAIEGTHYRITDKTLNLNSDTLSTGVINVEVQVVDDSEANENRQFKLKIISAEGANTAIAETTVTIVDNESNPYSAFGGQWYVNATNSQGNKVKVPMTIKAAQEGEYGYESILTGTTEGLCGYGEKLTWTFEWIYDDAAGEGALSLVVSGTDTKVGDYDAYTLNFFLYQPPFEGSIGTGTLDAPWTITGNTIPATITFNSTYGLFVAAAANSQLYIFDYFENISLTRE
ncbi:Calx-beta domain-containing protein [uncultured Prevotella sp.]|uniref:Calx-beta domain-containing protein n=1 Tax=uncultured Prevotella sp. TaxID=159272 RepID=UPI0026274E09|nr:Calx-beta domain-containing protein [uncultured Prevotella sp.]